MRRAICAGLMLTMCGAAPALAQGVPVEGVRPVEGIVPVVREGRRNLEPVIEAKHPVPVYQRWYFWTAIAVGVAIAAVVGGLLLRTPTRPVAAPSGLPVPLSKPLFSW